MKNEEWRERERICACWLCNFPEIGNRHRHLLVELCGSAEAAYTADRKKWGQVLSQKQVESLVEYTAKWQPEKEYRHMKEAGISLLTVSEADYPRRLKNIPDPPYGIFVKGRLPEESVPAVAVIGARECSEYGRYVAAELGAKLGCQEVTVVSGMARGIDGISQEAALEAGGSSVGVLGCGVDICYPAQNKELYAKLLKKGAVLSPYPIGTPAIARNFPPRNRIVSGLADAVVVIEARVKSGTLITVDMALEQGREVYVVPGRVTDRLSDGCNRLIKQGAGVFLSPESFLEEIRLLVEQKRSSVPSRLAGSGSVGGKKEAGELAEGLEAQGKRVEGLKSALRGGRWREKPKQDDEETERITHLPPELAEIYNVLDFCPKSPAEIGLSLSDGYSDRQIVTRLMQLCLENLAIQVSPGYFCRKGK